MNEKLEKKYEEYIAEAFEHSELKNVHAQNDVMLRWAIENRYFDIAKKLLKSGADISVNNCECIKKLVSNDDLQFFKYLIDENILNVTNKLIVEIESYSYQCKKYDIIIYLKNEYVNKKPFIEQETANQKADHSIRSNIFHLIIIVLLLGFLTIIAINPSFCDEALLFIVNNPVLLLIGAIYLTAIVIRLFGALVMRNKD